MRRIVFVISIFGLVIASPPSFAAPVTLATKDWPTAVAHNLAGDPPSPEAINAFMNRLKGGWDGICSGPRFVDLRRSGTLSLVIAEATNTRACPLLVVDKRPDGFQVSQFNDGPDPLVIGDFAGDGKIEFIGYSDFTSYMGAQHCVASWPVVWAWTGSRYADVSAENKAYYQKDLASLKRQVAEAESEPPTNSCIQEAGSAGEAEPQPGAANPGAESMPLSSGEETLGYLPRLALQVSPPQPLATPDPLDGALDCAKAEAAKDERFLGISRYAGMSDAIKWADSDSPYDRRFAADVLADIATPEALEYLKTLSHDSDRFVAMQAQAQLKEMQGLPHLNTAEVENIPMSAVTTSQ